MGNHIAVSQPVSRYLPPTPQTVELRRRFAEVDYNREIRFGECCLGGCIDCVRQPAYVAILTGHGMDVRCGPSRCRVQQSIACADPFLFDSSQLTTAGIVPTMRSCTVLAVIVVRLVCRRYVLRLFQLLHAVIGNLKVLDLAFI